MRRKCKFQCNRIVAFLMIVALSLGTPIFASATEKETEETVVINLFDLNDPNLVEVVDVQESSRTTSRPTAYYDLDAQGKYSYSAYSSNNIMWTKYIFYTQDGHGSFLITANSTNTNYRMRIYNCANGKYYIYNITSTSVAFYNSNISNWTQSSYFYFGIDTTATGKAVSVNGAVDTY